MEEDEHRPPLNRALLHRSATNNTSQVAMVGSNPCPIESLDYEYAPPLFCGSASLSLSVRSCQGLWILPPVSSDLSQSLLLHHVELLIQCRDEMLFLIQ